MSASDHANHFALTHEAERIEALHKLNLLDTAPSEAFDRITRLAAQFFDLPISAVSLTDIDRQWFKSRVGVPHTSIPRERAPCSQVAGQAKVLIIPDLLADDFYCESHLAKSGIRFYAGAPLMTDSGLSLGAMCVLGTEPREVSAREVATLSDLASMVMSQIELQHALGRIDPISGLPNRKQFKEDLDDLVRDGGNGEQRLLVMVNLAKYEELGDSVRVLGATVIEEYICQVAKLLCGFLGKERTLYHVAETQFAFFAPSGAEVHAYCEKVAWYLRSCHDRHRARLVVTPSVGIVPFVPGQISYGKLLRMAHSAAQEALQTDANVSVYSTKQDAAHFRRFSLLSKFNDALQAPQQLSLVYQPRIDIVSGTCIGAEALLRWTDPELGSVSPAEFIPLVEVSSMARETTAWVLDAAIAQLARWQLEGLSIQLSINISASNLTEPDFVQRLMATLDKYSVAPGRLELEVTESAIMLQPDRAQTTLKAISAAGIKLAIDDFGTGYSSLAYLQSLPADVVKIDQTFVRSLFIDQRKQMLVKAMVDLSHDLDYRVVAEGVETNEALGFLRSIGCDEAQGYYFAKPMAPQALVEWVNQRKSG